MLHLNDHLYSKPCVFLWVTDFRGLTAGFASLPTLSQAFIVGHICIIKNNGVFTQGGIYPYLLLPDTYFHFRVYNRATLLDVVPPYRVHHQTPNAVLIHTTHTHFMRFPSAYALRCTISCLYHVTYMMNVIWTILLMHITHASWTIISINIKFPNDQTFHVNIFAHTYININKSSPIKQ